MTIFFSGYIGSLQTGDGTCGEWVSEIFTGEDWIPGPSHPSGHSINPCLANINSTHSLLVGGLPAFTDTWILDWSNDSWSRAGDLLQGRQDHDCVGLDGENVLLAGGRNRDNTQELYSVELFDAALGNWTVQPDLPDVDLPGQPILLNWDGAVLGLFFGEDRVYQRRVEDGSWSQLVGVQLPDIFFGSHVNKVAIVPDYFAAGCVVKD